MRCTATHDDGIITFGITEGPQIEGESRTFLVAVSFYVDEDCTAFAQDWEDSFYVSREDLLALKSWMENPGRPAFELAGFGFGHAIDENLEPCIAVMAINAKAASAHFLLPVYRDTEDGVHEVLINALQHA